MSSRAIIIKSGYIYRQKTRWQKRWKKQWMVLFQDGCLFFRKDSASTHHGKIWNLKRDCMHLWGEQHCHHLLPPPESASTCLLELLFVGNKRLTLCALTELEAQFWIQAIDRARTERAVPTLSRHNSYLNTIDEDEELGNKSSCCLCFTFDNRVKEVNYRPATQGSTLSSYNRKRQHKRRVSWNDNIVMIS